MRLYHRKYEHIGILVILTLFLTTESARAQPAPDHYWTLDEEFDVRWDYVGEAHAVPLFRDRVSGVDAMTGKGIKLSATALAAKNLALGGPNSFTVAAWAKQTGADNVIVSSENYHGNQESFRLTFTTTSSIRARYSYSGASGSGINTASVSTGVNQTTDFNLYWLSYDATVPSISIAVNAGAWSTTALDTMIFPVEIMWFAGRYPNYNTGAYVDEVMLWEDYAPTDAERADIYANQRGPEYFGIDATPPASPFGPVQVVDSSFADETTFTEGGAYWLRPYPLREWSDSLAALKSDFFWLRSTDHTDAIDPVSGIIEGGVYIGYSDSPGVLPSSWSLLKNASSLRVDDPTSKAWQQLETPEVTYHPNDPDGLVFYLTAHANAANIGEQTTVLWRSSDLDTWIYHGEAFPNTTEYGHTGYATQVEWTDGSYRAYALLHGGIPGTHGWWSSEDALSWSVLHEMDVYATAVPLNQMWGYSGIYHINGRTYALITTVDRIKIQEIDDDERPVYPGWELFSFDGSKTYAGGSWVQGFRGLVLDDTLHLYVKLGYTDIDYDVVYLKAPILESTATPEGKLFAYDSGCLSTNYVLPEDFGTLTPGAAADSTQRAANTAAINAAIAAAPAGGSVCLPADSLFLTLDRAPTSYTSEGIILIARDSVALWGAGACGWGNLSGCSYIGTPGDQYYYRGPVNDDGKDHLVRGFGIKLVKPSGVNSLPHITLKGFELDGQSSWTGCYSFDYDWLYSVHWNCWDMGHKGIGIGSLADNLLIEDVKVHSYKGEIIYGNEPPGSVTLRRVWSYDSNGSAYNVSSAQTALVEDSKFGPDVRFWTEVLAEHKTDLRATFRNNVYEGCRITNGCIAIAADNASQAKEGQVWTWENNSFSCSEGQRAFYLKSGKYTGVIKDNTIDGCQLFITGNGGFTTNLQITGNTGNSGTMIFQYSRFAGIVSGNHFIGGKIYSVNNEGTKLGGLVIENNIYDGSSGPTLEGSSPHGAELPLVRNNTYLNFTHGKSDFYQHQLPHTGCPSYEYAEFRVWSTPDHISLCTLNADGQRVYLKGKGTLPASSPQHGWTEDIVLSETPVEVEFDRDLMKWFLAGEIPEPSLAADTMGGGSGSHTVRDLGVYSVTGRGRGIYRTQREGYALRKPIADGDSFQVRIDSLTTWSGAYERLQGGGIVISDSTSATSPGLYVLYRPYSQWLMVWHAQTENTVPVFAGLARIKAPFEVKVSRTGTAYTVSYSSDGETFTQLAEVNLTLTRPFVGVFSSSNNAGADTVLHVSGVLE